MIKTASKANMDAHYAPGVFAYSPTTGEEYSANPADYFFLSPIDTLPDAEGEPMILARKTSVIEAI